MTSLVVQQLCEVCQEKLFSLHVFYKLGHFKVLKFLNHL
jgi:hypothetical protein